MLADYLLHNFLSTNELDRKSEREQTVSESKKRSEIS